MTHLLTVVALASAGAAVLLSGMELVARLILDRCDRARWRREGLHTHAEVSAALARIWNEEHARG